MQFALFVILGFIWLSEMAWMVTIAPIGKHPFLFSVLFGLGHVLMILMVRWFPRNMAPVEATGYQLSAMSYFNRPLRNCQAPDPIPSCRRGCGGSQRPLYRPCPLHAPRPAIPRAGYTGGFPFDAVAGQISHCGN